MAGARPADGGSAPRDLAGRAVRSVRYRTRTAPRRARRALGRRVPPQAKDALSQGRRTVDRGRKAAGPRARQAYRELSPENQARVRRGHRELQRLRRASATGAFRPPAIATRPPAPRVPKGAPWLTWWTGYRRLVADTVPAGTRWIVVTPGGPRAATLGRGPGATPFPAGAAARPLAEDLAHIARLEALRYAGRELLVLPEGSRPWFRQHAELRSHVTGSYRALDDRPSAGVVYDLRDRTRGEVRSLRAEVEALVGAGAGSPAVLDWTDAGIDAELPGTTTFRPPDGDRLPYLDHSIEVVVTDGSHDAAEAARVAGLGLVTVSVDEGGGVTVRTVEHRSAPDPARTASRIVVWSADPDDDAGWRRALAEAAEAAGAILRLADETGDGPGALDDVDVVVVAEPGVVPLPGAIERASALALADTDAAVAGKVIDADGRLESAGGTVFGDRSAARIGRGSPDVRGPWHDFVRPVCWAPGLLAIAAELWRHVPPPDGGPSATLAREWSAGAWAAGHPVRYHPDVAAVRVTAAPDRDEGPIAETRWHRVLDLRPARPRDLDEGAWRRLLATDDVEACRA